LLPLSTPDRAENLTNAPGATKAPASRSHSKRFARQGVQTIMLAEEI
jgi:hypothetical protein